MNTKYNKEKLHEKKFTPLTQKGSFNFPLLLINQNFFQSFLEKKK